MMKQGLFCFVIFGLAAGPAKAELQPILINLSANNSTSVTYSVPVDKVLLVEHVQLSSPTNALNAPLIQASCGSESFSVLPMKWSDENRWVIDFAGIYVGFATLDRTLKFPSGCTLSCFPPGGSGGNGAVLMGMLADAADLFAAVGSDIEQMAQADDTIDMLVRLESARPVHLRAEAFTSESTEWKHRADATVTGTADATRKSVSLPAERPFELYRFMARPR